MIKFREFWKEFWDDERDCYGDWKATLILLLISGTQIGLVLGIYWWTNK